MNTPQLSQQYRVDPRARFRVLDSEGIFVLQEAGEVLVINPVGAFIVEQLQSSVALGDVVAAVIQRYEVEHTQAQQDALKLVESLLEAGAITES